MSVRLIAITQPVIAECAEPGDLVAYCARVSNPANQANTETAPRLLAYLARNHHWSPFEMASLTMEIKTTRDIARQILRHRSFSFQEFSQRYAEVIDQSVLRDVRLQDSANRQNSIPVDDPVLAHWWARAQTELADRASDLYGTALANGIAKEVARAVLPEGLTPSILYMAGSVRSWIHYIQLRAEPGTQLEHRVIAIECRRILVEQFPALSEIV